MSDYWVIESSFRKESQYNTIEKNIEKEKILEEKMKKNRIEPTNCEAVM